MEQVIEFLRSPIVTIGDHTLSTLQLLQVAGLVVLGGLLIIWSGRFLRHRMGARGVNRDLVQLLSRGYMIVGFVVLGLSTLHFLQVPLAAFAFISGAVAIGVGFGAQNIINNFISGWILMWERPIKIGDFLELDDVKGTVESINTRSTRIRRVDGVHLLVPNSHLLENTVTNWTLVDHEVRGTVSVGVAYGSDVRLVERLLHQAAQEHPDVLEKPAHKVFFEGFGDNSLDFTLDVWVHAEAEGGLRAVRSALRFHIDEVFRAHDVVIAFPQRDVHLDGTLVLQKDS